MGNIEYSGTFSSNGIEITTDVNTIINFQSPVSSLFFTNEGIDDLTIKFNNEDNIHLLKAGESAFVKKFRIDKITIVESSRQYSFNAMYY